MYPNELVSIINNLFSFDNDQQDSYELFHRTLDILDSFVIEFKHEENSQEFKGIIIL